MPKFLESKLKKQYPNNPGAVFGTMNKLGAMHGNKETKKGEAMEDKHKMHLKGLGGIKPPKPSGVKKKKSSFAEALMKGNK